MIEYRAFMMGGAGKINDVAYISKETDAAALDEARGLLEKSYETAVEVWDRKRLVGRVERPPRD